MFSGCGDMRQKGKFLATVHYSKNNEFQIFAQEILDFKN